ncbi:potassium voltage-gated channel subfamily H member 2-like [Protopterus annectens]|uniref:potassium voltage-gated channel subfamily H member 2-like n=1 Tax=Protopterus annectens TaxID=7888 RepID=UPI001CFB56D2|nr:potassium voltage-gated channel subfamily H member 2-like [Protopterus annectens]
MASGSSQEIFESSVLLDNIDLTLLIQQITQHIVEQIMQASNQEVLRRVTPLDDNNGMLLNHSEREQTSSSPGNFTDFSISANVNSWLDSPASLQGATNTSTSNSNNITSREQIAALEKLLYKCKSLQSDNTFLEESVKRGHFPKGLRFWKYPQGVTVNSVFHFVLLELFDRMGLDLTRLLIKDNIWKTAPGLSIPSQEQSIVINSGSCFLCLVDVVPVRNEDGAVIMFIMNFEVMTERDLSSSPERDANHKVPPPWFTSGRGRGFKLKLPTLRSLTASKQSLPQEDPESVIVDFSKHSAESVAMDEVNSITGNNCISSQPEDQKALIESENQAGLEEAERSTEPMDHSSPRDNKDFHLNLDMSFSNYSLTRSRSRDSCYSVRRASSVDDIEAMKGDMDKKFRSRHASTGAMNHIRSNLLNSTSDSDLMKYRTINKIPQITLNFVDFTVDPFITSPSTEKEIIAPTKLKDRTHNVTEKVTQVGVRFCLGSLS